MIKDESKQYSSLARAPYNLAIAYKYLEDNENLKTACESGVEYYDELIKMSKENPEFYVLKGELYMFLGNIVEAEKAYDYALKLDSDYSADVFNEKYNNWKSTIIRYTTNLNSADTELSKAVSTLKSADES